MRTLALSILMLASMPAFCATLHVGQGQSFVSIKPALAAARDGDIIIVHKGRYAEGEMIISKSICLRAEKGCVIDGRHASQIIRVEANDVVIEGFDIRNAGYSSSYDWAAIKVVNSSNVIIRNNSLFDNTFGIYFQNASACQIRDNRVIGNAVSEAESGNAIHCWKSDNIRIVNNTVSGHRDGIYFEFVTNSVVEKNNSYKNVRYGLHFMFSNNDSYVNNFFRANGSGVAVMFSHKVTMLNNHFQENWSGAAYGILMKEISDGVVENNTFNKNTTGIYLEGTNRMMIRKNNFAGNGWAMRIQSSCADNTIISNNFTANTFDVGTNGDVQLNKFDSNYWDRYEGYDLDRDGIGDIPFRPVSLYSMIVEKIPAASMLLRSLMVTVLDRVERIIPGLTPPDLVDRRPLIKLIK